MSKQPELVFMVGIPCSGKSTYAKEHFPNHVLISNDHVTQQHAEDMGITYLEAFNRLDYERDVLPVLMDTLKDAVRNKEDIVIDDTNTKVRSRARYLELFKDDFRSNMYHSIIKLDGRKYYKRAIVLHIDYNTYKARSEQRTEKTIPESAIVRMLLEYEKPTFSEGFDNICKFKVEDTKVEEKTEQDDLFDFITSEEETEPKKWNAVEEKEIKPFNKIRELEEEICRLEQESECLRRQGDMTGYLNLLMIKSALIKELDKSKGSEKVITHSESKLDDMIVKIESQLFNVRASLSNAWSIGDTDLYNKLGMKNATLLEVLQDLMRLRGDH